MRNIKINRDQAEYLIDLMDSDTDFCPQWHELYKEIADEFGMRGAQRLVEVNNGILIDHD
tara:strand:- start:206 stop:385 length:180 start_codon:yes stop_codon:yes gene_type:complete